MVRSLRLPGRGSVLMNTAVRGLCAIRALRRLAPRPAVYCTGRHGGFVTHPSPVAQAESLYLSFPELRLRDADRPVVGTVSPEQLNRPGDPIPRDLLLREVHADVPR